MDEANLKKKKTYEGIYIEILEYRHIINMLLI